MPPFLLPPPPPPEVLVLVFAFGGAIAVLSYGGYKLAETIGREVDFLPDPPKVPSRG
jgi:hypothetical protein